MNPVKLINDLTACHTGRGNRSPMMLSISVMTAACRVLMKNVIAVSCHGFIFALTVAFLFFMLFDLVQV